MEQSNLLIIGSEDSKLNIFNNNQRKIVGKEDSKLNVSITTKEKGFKASHDSMNRV